MTMVLEVEVEKHTVIGFQGLIISGTLAMGCISLG